MTTITFIQPDGAAREVVAKPGESGMQAATRAGVEGIIGECGGSCMCATCHVEVAPQDIGRLPPRDDIEQEMLESILTDVPEGSRLCCQIKLVPELDGLVLHVVEIAG
ncbi:2Fe-2S iron-sulfur cluster-binding protein [Kaistia dalseonensis]|uniref:2Fe-2S ferredoxin n=1 Tax=Kaistia dalseonensis TaxID=410840 RepID=A0ABU0H8N9_9HYPH|nr:2Fe-2S iron-sulfur cluster-binding protein [Kaistia dalseonensis]MCX5496076.1 2Fe-2S iron-sulfur cluster-binding protein [Kaistia dalseonensis]MDQ0438680.1 2Fe-2S ferredoxin [Kaistia dalseonensis]